VTTTTTCCNIVGDGQLVMQRYIVEDVHWYTAGADKSLASSASHRHFHTYMKDTTWPRPAGARDIYCKSSVFLYARHLVASAVVGAGRLINYRTKTGWAWWPELIPAARHATPLSPLDSTRLVASVLAKWVTEVWRPSTELFLFHSINVSRQHGATGLMTLARLNSI